jgi:hypothetical protein
LPRLITAETTRAGTGARPYKDDDAMNVVRHDNEDVEFQTIVSERQFVPSRFDHFAGLA